MKKIFSLVFGLVLLYPVVMGAKICQLGEMNGDGADSCSAIVSSMANTSNADGSQSLSFSNQDLGWKLPFTIGAQYSKLGSYGLQAKLAQGLNAYNAYALDLELAKSERRYSATFGHAFNDNQRLKFTAEYLTQNLDFDFTTGKVSEWVGQPAYGLAYQYVLSHGMVNAINLSVAYSKADSKTLSTISDSVLGIADYRRIAGGEDRMASAGVDLLPFDSSLVNLELNYDSLRYNTKYDAGNSKDRSGLGATAKLEQVLTDFLKVKLSASSRKPYQEYQAEIDWLMPALPGNRIEMALVGGHTIGSDGLSNNTKFGININYNLDPSTLNGTHAVYGKLGARKAMGDDLVQWTSTPAVRMAQVLAIKDELVLRIGSLNPAFGPCAGNTPVIISGSGFGDNNSVASVIFGGISGSKVSQDSSSQVTYKTPAHPAGKVDVTLTRSTGETVTLKNAYEFINSGSCVFVDDSAANNALQGSNASNKDEVSLDEGGKTLKVRCTGFQNNANNAGNYSVIINGKEITNVTPSETDPSEMSFATPAVSEVGASTQSPLKVKVNMPGIVGQEVDGTLTYYAIQAILDEETGVLRITADAPNPIPNLFTRDPKPKIYLDGQSGAFPEDLVQVTEDGSAIILGAINGQKIKVIVKNKGGTADGSSTSYDIAPEMTSISPDVILANGGQKKIVIEGRGFTLDAAGKHLTHVRFNDVELTDADITYTVDSDSKITITKLPKEDVGTVRVAVRDPGGKSLPIDLKYYGLGFTDASKHMPGEKAYIRGSVDTGKTTAAVANLFTSDAMLKFGDKEPVTCSSAPDAPCTVDTSTGEVSFTIPDMDSKNTGDVPVAINVTNKQDSLAADSADATFSYVPAKPVLVDAKPLTILPDGGLKTVTIQGNHLANLKKETAVMFNSVDVTSAVDPKDTDKYHISFKYSMPKHDPGSATFKATVATEGGTTPETDLAGFTYAKVDTDFDHIAGHKVKLTADLVNSFSDNAHKPVVHVKRHDSGTKLDDPVDADVSSDGKILTFSAPPTDANGVVVADVLVTNDQGQGDHVNTQITYNAETPVVKTAEFNWLETGAVNNLVLSGDNLETASKVTIAGKDYTPDSKDKTSVTLKDINLDAGTPSVTVTTDGGASKPVNITINRSPITSEFKSKVKGGLVTINAKDAKGAVFSDTAWPTINVHFDFDGHDMPATVLSVSHDGKSLTFEAPTTIKPQVGANEVVSAVVTVANPAGDSALTSIEYAAQTPAVASKTYNWLEEGAISEFAIKGENLETASKVKIGDLDNITPASKADKEITIKDLNLPTGTYATVVTTDGGDSDPVNIEVTRSAIQAKPDVVVYKQLVTITADEGVFDKDHLPTVEVQFDGYSKSGENVQFVSSKEITFEAPSTNEKNNANEEVSAVILVTNLAKDFAKCNIQYTAKTPKITSIDLNHGPTIGGTEVKITGENFVSGATVTIGSSATVKSISATEIVCETTAHAAGPADVVVNLPDGQAATLQGDHYTYNALESVTVTAEKDSIAKGSQLQFKAEAKFANEDKILDVTKDPNCIWSSSQAGFASIDSVGLVTAISEGVTDITAKYSDSFSEKISLPKKLTVIAAELTSIAITPKSSSIAKGETQGYTLMGTYSDGQHEISVDQAEWQTSDATKATVEKGVATGVNKTDEGTPVTITATVSGKSDTATLTVTEAKLNSIAITPKTSSIAKGETQSYTLMGTYADGTREISADKAEWHTSDATKATVEKGVATGVNKTDEGTPVTITATVSGKSDSAALTVTAAKLIGIEISPINPTIMVDETKQFMAFKKFTDGTTERIDVDHLDWTSMDTAVATVEETLGIATGVKGGQTTITANFNDGTKVWTDNTTLTVKDLPPSIDSGQSSDWLQDGGKRKITIYGNYLSGMTLDGLDVVGGAPISHGEATASADGKRVTISDVNMPSGVSTVSVHLHTTAGSAEGSFNVHYHGLTLNQPTGSAGTPVIITTDNIAKTELFAPNLNVTFGTGESAKPAENIKRVDGHTITCNVPNLDTNSTDTVPVTVQNQNQDPATTDSATQFFTYKFRPIIPAQAIHLLKDIKKDDNQTIVLHGSKLAGANAVSVSGCSACSVVTSDETSITIANANLVAGTYSTTVTTPEGTSTPADITITRTPVITTFSGKSGDQVTVEAADGNQVFSKASPASLPKVHIVMDHGEEGDLSGVTVDDSLKKITFKAPSPLHQSGANAITHSAAITVTNPGKDVAKSGFDYKVPTVTADQPFNWLSGGGSKNLSIKGTDLDGVTSVTIGEKAFTGEQIIDKTSTGFTVKGVNKPATDTPIITVTTPLGTSEPQKLQIHSYSLIFAPTSKTSGPIAGGTDVTITASDPTVAIFDKASVKLSDFVELKPETKTSTSITVTTKQHEKGAVKIHVINSDAQGDYDYADSPDFTYSDAPIIDSVTRVGMGQPYVLSGGGTLPDDSRITIKGSHFKVGNTDSKVKVGNTDLKPEEFSVDSDTQITIKKVPVRDGKKAGDDVITVSNSGGDTPAITKLQYVGVSGFALTSKTYGSGDAAQVDGGDDIAVTLDEPRYSHSFYPGFVFNTSDIAYGTAAILSGGKTTTPSHKFGEASVTAYVASSSDSEHALYDTDTVNLKLNYHRVYLQCPVPIDAEFGWAPNVLESNGLGNSFTTTGAKYKSEPNPNYTKFTAIYAHGDEIKPADSFVCQYGGREARVALRVNDDLRGRVDNATDKKFIDKTTGRLVKDYGNGTCISIGPSGPDKTTDRCTLVYTVQ